MFSLWLSLWNVLFVVISAISQYCTCIAMVQICQLIWRMGRHVIVGTTMFVAILLCLIAHVISKLTLWCLLWLTVGLLPCYFPWLSYQLLMAGLFPCLPFATSEPSTTTATTGWSTWACARPTTRQWAWARAWALPIPPPEVPGHTITLPRATCEVEEGHRLQGVQ